MILKVFAVHDMKAKAFLQPFYSPSIGSALRAFGDACGEVGSPFNKHPEDYVIYEIGTYDDSTGALVAIPVVKMLGSAVDYVSHAVKSPECLPAKEFVASVVGNGKKSS